MNKSHESNAIKPSTPHESSEAPRTDVVVSAAAIQRASHANMEIARSTKPASLASQFATLGFIIDPFWGGGEVTEHSLFWRKATGNTPDLKMTILRNKDEPDFWNVRIFTNFPSETESRTICSTDANEPVSVENMFSKVQELLAEAELPYGLVIEPYQQYREYGVAENIAFAMPSDCNQCESWQPEIVNQHPQHE